MAFHPDGYGPLPVVGQRYPLHATWKGQVKKIPCYDAVFLAEDPYFQVIGASGKTLTTKGNTGYTVKIPDSQGFFTVPYKHAVMHSAFPLYRPAAEETHVVLIDPDKPLSVENMRWVTRSESAKLGQKKSVQSKNEKGANGISIQGVEKATGETYGPFKSTYEAASFVYCHKHSKEEWDALSDQERTKFKKARGSKIEEVVKGKRPSDWGFVWTSLDGNLEGEEWAAVPDWYYSETGGSTRHEVSNKGRVRKNSTQYVMHPSKNGKQKYRKAPIPGDPLLHRVIYEAFHGRIPEDQEVCHDESLPLDKDGCHRNWLEDLTLGTRGENMCQFHAAKRQKVLESM
jgi:hypothetical protein